MTALDNYYVKILKLKVKKIILFLGVMYVEKIFKIYFYGVTYTVIGVTWGIFWI